MRRGFIRDEIAYPHLRKIAIEFELPLPLTAKIDAPAPREYARWTIQPPVTPRPVIADYTGKTASRPIVQLGRADRPR